MFKRTVAEVPQNIDWARRALPTEVAAREVEFRGSDFRRIASAVKRENIAFMHAVKAAGKGKVIGYHGTTTANAQKIADKGFENRWSEEEGLSGVSAWDASVAHEALKFALNRSRKAGAHDAGRIIKVSMTDPDPDLRYGRLEWLADARQTEVLDVYTPEDVVRLIGPQEMVRRLGGVSLSHIHGAERFMSHEQLDHAIV